MKSRSKYISMQETQMRLFYAPALLLFLIFIIYPFLKGVYFSTTNWNGYSQEFDYVGFKNYIRLFGDKNFKTALSNTFVYGLGSTLIQNVLGLMLALFVNQKFAGRGTVRAIIYLPVMISPVIMANIMYFLFTYHRGALNDIVSLFGHEPINWLADGKRSVYILTLVNSLHHVGISMVIYLAGLQNIPQMYRDAAVVDGANGWKMFTYITFPLLSPAIQSSVTLNLIGSLKLFDIINALTGGGPGYSSHSLSSLIHRTYFGAENAGYASAIGLITFLLILVLSLTVSAILSRKEIEA